MDFSINGINKLKIVLILFFSNISPKIWFVPPSGGGTFCLERLLKTSEKTY